MTGQLEPALLVVHNSRTNEYSLASFDEFVQGRTLEIVGSIGLADGAPCVSLREPLEQPVLEKLGRDFIARVHALSAEANEPRPTHTGATTPYWRN